MIQVTELRIGNFFKEIGPDDEQQIVRRVESIIKLGDPSHEDSMEYHVNEHWTLDMIEGIPLTGEWLIRFGATKSDIEKGLYLLVFDATTMFPTDYWIKEGDGGFSISSDISESYICFCEAVHDFQNAMYVLEKVDLP